MVPYILRPTRPPPSPLPSATVAGGVALRDRAAASPAEAADVFITHDGAGGVALRDHAAVIVTHQAAHAVVAARHRAAGIGLRDRAGVGADQAANGAGVGRGAPDIARHRAGGPALRDQADAALVRAVVVVADQPADVAAAGIHRAGVAALQDGASKNIASQAADILIAPRNRAAEKAQVAHRGARAEAAEEAHAIDGPVNVEAGDRMVTAKENAHEGPAAAAGCTDRREALQRFGRGSGIVPGGRGGGVDVVHQLVVFAGGGVGGGLVAQPDQVAQLRDLIGRGSGEAVAGGGDDRGLSPGGGGARQEQEHRHRRNGREYAPSPKPDESRESHRQPHECTSLEKCGARSGGARRKSCSCSCS